jgi:uncharacterized protein (TIGR02466 family)
VRRFAAALDFDLTARKLVMTDCWVNVMTRQVVHGLHLHPLASISGTYYVRTPRGCSGLKFEDPRLDRYMAAPPRKHARGATTRCGSRSRPNRATWCCSRAGCATRSRRIRPRPSASRSSFNYSWF